MIRYKLARALAAVACTVGAGLIGVASALPASATPGCADNVYGTTDNLEITGTPDVELGASGVTVNTKTNADSAKFWRSVGPYDLEEVKRLSYTTFRYDQSTHATALPAYRVKLDNDATLVYEPYYRNAPGSDAPIANGAATWEAMDGTWWTSASNVNGMTAEGGGSYAGNNKWADIVAANPDRKVVAFGWGQGTYNPGTVARLTSIRFVVQGCDIVDRWKTPKAEPTATPTAQPTTQPTATPTAGPGTGNPSTSPSVGAGGVGGNDPQLPRTGPGAMLLKVGGGVLVGGLVLVSIIYAYNRRKSTEFIAG